MSFYGDYLYTTSLVDGLVITLLVCAIGLMALFPELIPSNQWVDKIKVKVTRPSMVRDTWAWYKRPRVPGWATVVVPSPVVAASRWRAAFFFLLRKWEDIVLGPRIISVDRGASFSSSTGFSCLLYRHTTGGNS